MQQKTCTKCNETKELDCFVRSKSGLFGRRSQCKSCVYPITKEYQKNKWDNDPEYRSKITARSYEWQSKNKEARSKIAKKRNSKEKEKFPEKVKARRLVNQRVKFGRIPKAKDLNCNVCGNQAAHYHHHLGYAWEHRYDVVPVCAPCHQKLG